MRLKLLAAILGPLLTPAVAPLAAATPPEPTVLYPATWYPGSVDSAGASILGLAPGDSATGLTIPIGRAGGSIRIRVLAEGDSAAVPGILVEAVRGSLTAVALTNVEGIALIEGVPAGPAIVRARPDDPRSETGAFAVTVFPSPVLVTDGTVRDAGDFLVARGGRIKALVRRPNGDPWPGIPVILRSADGAFRVATRTEADGRAHMGGLRAGPYRLWADARGTDSISEAWDGSRDTLNSATIAVTEDTLITGIEITPDLGGTIAGAVRDAGSNAGIPNVVVEVIPVLDPSAIYRYRTQELGFYTANGLPTGSYKIYVPAIHRWYPDTPYENEARVVQATEGETVYRIDIHGYAPGDCIFPPEATGTVEGSVRMDFTIVPRARIVVWNDSDTASLVISTGGGYSIPCVYPGTYRAAIHPSGVYREQYHPKTNDPDSALVFNVAAGDTTRRIDFEPERSVTLSGRVIDRDTGSPLAGIRVVARLASPRLMAIRTTGLDGFFRFDSLADGSGLPAGEWTASTDSIAIPSLDVVPIRSVGLTAHRDPAGIRLDMEVPDLALSDWTVNRSDGRTIATARSEPEGTHARSCLDRGADGSLRYRLTVDLEAGMGSLESEWTDPLVIGPDARIGPTPWNGMSDLRLPPGVRDGNADLFSISGRRVATYRVIEGRLAPRAGQMRPPSGIYFLRLMSVGGPMRTERIVVVR